LAFVTAEITDDSLAGVVIASIVDAPTGSQLGIEVARMREQGHCLQRKRALTSTADLVDFIIQLSRSAVDKHGGPDDGGLGK
jgi:hypothetical protein